MKAVLLTCVVLSCAVSLTPAADPKSKKGPKIDKGNAKELIAANDADSDKKLDKTELSNALKRLKRNVITTKNDSWKKFDEDGDDKIDQKELEKLLDANAEPEAPPTPTDTKDKGKTKAPYKGPTPPPNPFTGTPTTPKS